MIAYDGDSDAEKIINRMEELAAVGMTSAVKWQDGGVMIGVQITRPDTEQYVPELTKLAATLAMKLREDGYHEPQT